MPAALLFVAFFLATPSRAAEQIVLDLDATEVPIHGHRPGRDFHGPR